MDQAPRGPRPCWREAGEGRDSQVRVNFEQWPGRSRRDRMKTRPARGHSQLVGWPEHHIIEYKWAGALSRILLSQLELCEIFRLCSSN